MCDFKVYLREANIDPADVMLMRHTPKEAKLKENLPRLAQEKPELYNWLQLFHGPSVEQRLVNAKPKYLASFIGHEPEKAVFIGLWSFDGERTATRRELMETPEYAELKTYGAGWLGDPDGVVIVFNLTPTDILSEWKGKLIIGWSGGASGGRSWTRHATSSKGFPVKAILEISMLVEAKMPKWSDIKLTWAELKILPPNWCAALKEWRGVYYIWDKSIEKGYVGSAYGEENLYGRWLNYAKNGNGGNKLLKDLKPENLLFTILERASPDETIEGLVEKENRWKETLHTRLQLNAN